MQTDYSPFLHVHDDGRIWWPLLDAVKLGAGYKPLRDDERNLEPVLRASNNRVLVNERNLLSEFGPTHYTDAHPRTPVRDGARFVEAQEFLMWLADYVKCDPDMLFPYPLELASAVERAKASHAAAATAAQGLVSLTDALEPWFDRPFCDLPAALKKKVVWATASRPWDELSASERRTCTMADDASRNPEHDAANSYGWKMGLRKLKIEQQIKQWADDQQASADVRVVREHQLSALKRELAMIERVARTNERGLQSFGPTLEARDGVADASAVYIAYPRALHELGVRIGATPDEMAAWVFKGRTRGGLTAYRSPGGVNPPQPFHCGLGVGSEQDFDYLTPLQGCWFRQADLLAFDPESRYLTGKALVERWRNVPGIEAEAFIIAKVRASELFDLHPITGCTQATETGHDGYPPLTNGLFLLKVVLQIEADQFPQTFALAVSPSTQITPSSTSRSQVFPVAIDSLESPDDSNGTSNFPSAICAVFREMPDLRAEEITISFIGDTSDTGLAANNLVEFFARGISRRVAAAEFGLVNRKTGVLNSQGAVLVGLTTQRNLPYTEPNKTKMSRIRALLKAHLGFDADPFDQYRASVGWLPRFKILDRRGAAEERAEKDALRKTISLEQEQERGRTIVNPASEHEQFEHEDDPGGNWLDKNDFRSGA